MMTGSPSKQRKRGLNYKARDSVFRAPQGVQDRLLHLTMLALGPAR